MNSERKAFIEAAKEIGINTAMVETPMGLQFKYGSTNDAFKIWQASTQRQGYKLVPLEMSWQKADDLASKEWGKNKSMFCSNNRDMTALQVEEFRLRWCKNKAHQIMNDYKAMIGAVDENC